MPLQERGGYGARPFRRQCVEAGLDLIEERSGRRQSLSGYRQRTYLLDVMNRPEPLTEQ